MDNNTLCSSEEEVFRVKVLGFYIYFLMIVNTSIIVWHTIGDYTYNNLKQKNVDKDKEDINLVDNNRKWFFSTKIE